MSKAPTKAPVKAFASQADLTEKKITFEQLSEHCWAYTAEGDSPAKYRRFDCSYDKRY